MKRAMLALVLLLAGCGESSREAPIVWERLAAPFDYTGSKRTAVPGGWLVATAYAGCSVDTVYIPDPDHAWLSAQLEQR